MDTATGAILICWSKREYDASDQADLGPQAREIARLCHTSNRPVFITRNGERDLVVMSQAHYNRLVARLELYQRLEEAEHQVRRGRKTLGHQEVMRKLRAQLG